MGSHLILDLTFPPGVLESMSLFAWKLKLRRLVADLGLNILDECCHTFGTDYAVTVLLLLSTSHASVHTWHERNQVAIDIFHCGGELDQKIVQQWVKGLGAIESKAKVIQRG